MSPEALLEHPEKMLQLYQSIVNTYKELKPLENTVLEYEKRLKEGNITKFEAQLVKMDMDKVLEMYAKLEKTSNEIREARKLFSYSKEGEVNAIIETKIYLLAEGFKAHSHMMSSKTPQERIKYADAAEGLSHAEDIISAHAAEIGEEFEKIRKELSARKLL
jgi:hypothetical protein